MLPSYLSVDALSVPVLWKRDSREIPARFAQGFFSDKDSRCQFDCATVTLTTIRVTDRPERNGLVTSAAR